MSRAPGLLGIREVIGICAPAAPVPTALRDTGLLGMPVSQGAGTGASGPGGTTAPNPGAPMVPPGAIPWTLMPERMLPAQPLTPMPEIPLAPARTLMPSATLGQATSVGDLSVPSSWATATPEAIPAAAAPNPAPMAGAPAAAPLLARAQAEGMQMRSATAAELQRLVVSQRSMVG
jgi:PPE-SVP subfamily C-terminal region